jgi:hypothetical protein
MIMRKPQVNAGVSARPLRRSVIILQQSCWSVRLSIAARLLPDAPSPTFGTTIRIAPLHHPCCLSYRADDLRFLLTVSDRWCPLLPVRDRCDTDPARTEAPGVPAMALRSLLVHHVLLCELVAARRRDAASQKGDLEYSMRDRGDRDSAQLRARLEAVERERKELRDKLRRAELDRDGLKRDLADVEQDLAKVRDHLTAIKRDIDDALSRLGRGARSRRW